MKNEDFALLIMTILATIAIASLSHIFFWSV
jgi:hypothetical protein